MEIYIWLGKVFHTGLVENQTRHDVVKDFEKGILKLSGPVTITLTITNPLADENWNKIMEEQVGPALERYKKYKDEDFKMTDISWKEVLKQALVKLGIIKDRFTGEITIGMTEGGVKFVRKSETIKEPEKEDKDVY